MFVYLVDMISEGDYAAFRGRWLPLRTKMKLYYDSKY